MRTVYASSSAETSDAGESNEVGVDLITLLDLQPHPEGGHFRETIRTADGPDGRSRMTAILFLLAEGERSHWHRVDADEVWLWHSGTPLTLWIDGQDPIFLGPDAGRGQQVQAIVPAGTWQSAEVATGWALMTCVVAPGFEFGGFELAPPGWSPN
ncbi:cupin (plasmid) [Sphingomonas psychrotolerans]|uniref:Cupin n=1 Tax=Sphingomonas psychrotolerans TaxID=1327635 RepID=A0A2K8MM07_9SPHN|nr:cupin [Sphingomonas psychrotolerans]